MAQPGPNSGWTGLAHRVGPILPPLTITISPTFSVVKGYFCLNKGITISLHDIFVLTKGLLCHIFNGLGILLLLLLFF